MAVGAVVGLALVTACGHSTTTTTAGVRPGSHDHLLGDLDPASATVTEGPDGRWYTTYPDLVEVSAWPAGAEPTDDQRRAGEEFVAQVRAALAGLLTVEDAIAAGYDHPEAIDEFHLVNRNYLDDGATLDPARPEFLVIDPDAGRVLGAMFLWTPGEHGPQLAGPASVWHYHDATSGGESFRCWDGSLPIPGAYDPATDTCRRGDRRDQSPEMLHVWAIDHPRGPFATTMPSRS